MKILLAQNQLYLPCRGDAQWTSRALLPALVAAGHSCCAVVPAFGSAECPTRTHYFGEWAERGLKVSWASADADVYEVDGAEIHAVLEPEKVPTYLLDRIQSFEPQAVLVSGEDPTGLLAALPGDVPAKVVALAYRPLDATVRALDGGPLRLDGVAAVEETLAGILAESLDLPVATVSLPGNIEALEAAEGELVILPEATREDGLDLFLALARRLPEVDFGTVESLRTRSDDAAALAALDNVEILEPSDDWDELFEDARAVLVPRMDPWEGRTVVREAMARGLPVLASDLEGLRGAKLGVDFLLPPPGDLDDEGIVATWANTVERLVDDEDLHQGLAEASRQAVLEEHERADEGSLVAFLDTVVAHPRAARAESAGPVGASQRTTVVSETGEIEEELAATAGAAERAGQAAAGPHFSLFFFSADGSQDGDRKYRLLHESARIADRNGFTAVWTPERHFNAFGGLYPNPAVTSASLATITENLQLRAGSVVLPLQNPLRVAEEWSMVDNMSGGRVGIAFASGWHVNDFVLAPANYEPRRKVMYDQIRTVQRLWRGETVELDNGAGKPTEVRVFPKPLQSELPIWITGQSDTSFARAGEIGANVLTNMNQKSLDEFATKVKVYREARERVGLDPANGVVTLMLHTYVTEDLDRARDQLKSAYGGYLLTNMGLQMQLAKGVGADVAVGQEDKELIMDLAFERLLQSHGLVGTPETCVERVADFHAAGVDEIGCLIDFGLDVDTVLESIERLGQLCRDCKSQGSDRPVDESIAARENP